MNKKVTLNLFDVHSNFKVRFTSFVMEDSIQPNQKQNEVIYKFSLNGNEYIKVSPKSYVIIDISTKQDRGENYSSNTQFFLNRKKLFLFILKLEKIYRCFTEEKNLFFLNNNNELSVDYTLAEMHRETFIACGNKTIQMQPSVYTDTDGQTYECIYLAINSLNYFGVLTYDQIHYLIYELRKIDFSSIELNLLNIVLQYSDKAADKLELPGRVEIVEPEIVDTKKKIFINDEAVIPNI